MKKFMVIFITVLLFSLSACESQSNQFSIEILPDNIEQIAVKHYRGSDETEWLMNGDEIEEWEKWLNSLSAEKKNFNEGDTPGDVNGGEVYFFIINNEEPSISYVINGIDDCYLLFESQWYAVSNPSDPCQSNSISESNFNIIPYSNPNEAVYKKPVIYLYPEETSEVAVKLDYNGELICTYPTYNEGWTVTAHPDGTLINQQDGKEYSYLFWEGISEIKYEMSKGFVVKGGDTADFLRDKLEYMGLTPREYNEFIVFWLPEMQNNPYNLITFQNKVYTDNAKLDIIPEPDSILRVFMAYKALDEAISIEEQNLEPFKRQGFTVIEWGGAVVN